MINRDYITEIYFFVDEIIKILNKSEVFDYVQSWNPYRKGRKKQLTLSEVIALNIIRYIDGLSSLKAFHKIATIALLEEFPKIPNYVNFLKATNQSLPYITLILQLLLDLSKYKSNSVISAVDATPLPVCENRRINRHKVCKKYAERGKTTKGWFYGFKLHGVSDLNGNLLSIMITPGNTDDRKPLDTLFKGIYGTILGDAGYLLKEVDFEKLLRKDKYLFTGVRNNMGKLMTRCDHKLLKKRQIIETAWSVLKDKFMLVTSKARSVEGLMRHYIYAVIAYIIRNITRNDFKLLEAEC